MKKSNKLQINAERLIKNEDLLKIRGGEYKNACTCLCHDQNGTIYGYYVAPDGNCSSGCGEAFKGSTGNCLGN